MWYNISGKVRKKSVLSILPLKEAVGVTVGVGSLTSQHLGSTYDTSRLQSLGSSPTAGTGLAGAQEKTMVAFNPTDGLPLKNQVPVHVCTAWGRCFPRRSCKGFSENFLRESFKCLQKPRKCQQTSSGDEKKVTAQDYVLNIFLADVLTRGAMIFSPDGLGLTP